MKILGPNDTTYIYCLLYENNIRYIGKTDKPQKRLKQHILKSKQKKTYKDNWIYSLLQNSQKPEMIILDEVPKESWAFWESFYIDLFKSWNYKLTNLTNGGDGGNFGPIVNKKISEKKKGWKMSNETKDKLRNFRLGRKESIEFTRKRSEFSKGQGNPMFGKKRKLEWDENKRKKIIQYDLNGIEIKIWDSIEDASKLTKTNRTSINYVLKNKRKSAGGYYWKYYNIY